MTIIGLIIIIGILYVLCHVDEWKFDSRTTPLGYKTDWDAMNKDLANGMSKQDVMRKSNRGGYDIIDK